MFKFNDIYSQHFKKVYLFILSLSKNKMIAEEITQETFFKAMKNIKQFRGTCKIDVWLCQIAKNTYYSYAKKHKQPPENNILYEPTIEKTVEEIIQDREESFRIHKLLHKLEEPYKEVFTLKVFCNLSFKQISQLFEKTENWSRVVFYRSKQKLRILIKEDDSN